MEAHRINYFECIGISVFVCVCAISRLSVRFECVIWLKPLRLRFVCGKWREPWPLLKSAYVRERAREQAKYILKVHIRIKPSLGTCVNLCKMPHSQSMKYYLLWRWFVSCLYCCWDSDVLTLRAYQMAVEWFILSVVHAILSFRTLSDLPSLPISRCFQRQFDI